MSGKMLSAEPKAEADNTESTVITVIKAIN